MRNGRKSAAQTKAPIKDRIKGSAINKKGSASSVSRASSIVLSNEIIEALTKKADDFNQENKKNKVSLNTLKAVFRRGAGAFSTSHRPNMTRNGWAYARVNKFLEKKGGKEVKKAYIQDDDLLENGGSLGQEITCHNCGWQWNTSDSDDSDKYVCHKCGFDNTLFYSNDIMSKGGLIAPNGKPSNLTPNQYKLVRTPQFKAWFGDWENDPQNASKVVDENGEPLVVYHGTNSDFTIFKIKPRKDSIDNDYYESGMWFFAPSFDKNKSKEERDYFYREGNAEWMAAHWNDNRDENGNYIKNKVIEVFLNVRNPKVIDGNTELQAEYLKYYSQKMRKDLKNDAIILHGSVTDGNVFRDDINILNANQIKLADGTNTTFDMNKADIRYKEGGQLSIDDNGLMDSIFPKVRDAFKKHGLKLEKNYAFTDGYNKMYLPYTGIQKNNGNVDRVGITYYEDGYEVLGEIVVDVQEQGGIKINVEFPNWQVLETFSIFAKGGQIDKVHEKLKEDLINDSFKSHKDIEQIAEEKAVDLEYAKEQLRKGMQTESEHSNDPMVQEIIALQHLDEMIDYYEKLEYLEGQKMEKGGQIDPNNKKTKDMITHKAGNAGGLLVGNRHSEGGIKAVNKSTNSPLEMEGGEVVITRNAVSDNEKREFEGEMLTNREILSKINEGGGGVSFEKGGDVDYNINCDDYMADGGSLKKFDPKSVVGKILVGKIRFAEIVDVKDMGNDNVWVTHESFSGFTSEENFTKDELFEMSNGKEVRGEVIRNKKVKSKMVDGGETKKANVLISHILDEAEGKLLEGRGESYVWDYIYKSVPSEIKGRDKRMEFADRLYDIVAKRVDKPLMKSDKMADGGELDWGADLGDGFSVGNDVYITDSHSRFYDKTGYIVGKLGKSLVIRVGSDDMDAVVNKKYVQRLEAPEFAKGGNVNSDLSDKELKDLVERLSKEKTLDKREEYAFMKAKYMLDKRGNSSKYDNGGELDVHSELKQFHEQQNTPIVIEEPIVEEVIEEEVVELPTEIMLYKEDLTSSDDFPMIYVGSSIYANNTNGSDEWVVKSFSNDGVNLLHIPSNPLLHKHEDKHISFDELTKLFKNNAISIKFVLNERELNLILMIIKDKLQNTQSFKVGGVVLADEDGSNDEEIMKSQFGNKKF